MKRRAFATLLVTGLAGCSDGTPEGPTETSEGRTTRHRSAVETATTPDSTAEASSDEITSHTTEAETPEDLIGQASDGTVIQDDQSDDRDAVVLTDRNWRDSIDTAELTDGTAAFLDETDFRSTAVVLVEYGVASASHRLRLRDITHSDSTVQVTFQVEQPENGVQGEGTRLLAVRLDRPAPEAVRVCVQVDDDTNCFDATT